MVQLLFGNPSTSVRSKARLRPVLLIGVLTLLLAVSGCEERAEISRYQVKPIKQVAAGTASPDSAIPKPDTNPEGEPQRMLAVIIPVESEAWFLKAMGPIDQIAGMESDFRAVMDGMTFESNLPSFQLPDGWRKQPGTAFRFATLVSQDREISVTTLPLNTDLVPYLVSNINRWRGQLSLPPIEASGLNSAAKELEVAGNASYFVDITGTASSSGMSPPMAGASSRRPPPPVTSDNSNDTAPTPSTSDTSPASDSGWKYDTPEGWTPGRTNTFRVAAFNISRDEGDAEVTVIPLGKAAGSVLENVNRWRGQIGLAAVDEAELEPSLVEVTAGPLKGSYVELLSEADDGDGILAAIIPTDEQTIFVKLLGKKPVAVAEAAAFRKFVESIRTPAP